jgi:hypothetical protein
MADLYRVTVVRESDGESETVMEFAGTLELVQGPGAALVSGVMKAIEAPDGDDAPATGSAPEGFAEVPPPAKRKRRTKAEMAADRAREEAAAAEPSPGPETPSVPTGPDHTPPLADPEPELGGPGQGGNAERAPGAPAAPFNPFERK